MSEHARDDYGSGTAPDFLTLAEAAVVLRVGRTAMYELARRHEATGGTEGDIAVIRIGHQFRVPRAWLEEKLGAPITWPLASVKTVAVSPSEQAAPRPTKRSPSRPAPRASTARTTRTAPSSRRRVDDAPTLFSV